MDVPRHAPAVVAIASANRACFAFGTRPRSSSMFALAVTPIRVPTVSNISTNRKVKRIIAISRENTLEKSNWNINGERLGTLNKWSVLNALRSVTPKGIPMMVAASIPISSAPLTFLENNTPMITRPMIQTSGPAEAMLPTVTRVASEPTTIPAFLKPISAIKKPIPAEIARFRLTGILLMIASRMLVPVRRIKITPSRKTAVSAVCQE